MIAQKVVTEAQVKERLENLGFEVTTETTDTGTFWKNTKTKRHLLVPFSVQGYYPDWLLWDLEDRIGRLNPWSMKPAKPKHPQPKLVKAPKTKLVKAGKLKPRAAD